MNAAPDRKVFEEALQCCFNVIRSAELGKEKTIFAAWSGHAMKHTFQAGFDKVDAVDRLYEAGIAIGLDVSFIQDCLAEAVRFAENGADARAEDGGNAIGDRAIGTAIFSPLNVRSSEDFLTTNFPERESVLAPIFKTQALIMVAAYRGVGKTHFVLACGAAIASGSKFLKWIAPFARPVLYVDGEMPASDLQERLRGLSYRCDGRFRILSLDDQKLGYRSTCRGRRIRRG